jgi:hypothetical protein
LLVWGLGVAHHELCELIELVISVGTGGDWARGLPVIKTPDLREIIIMLSTGDSKHSKGKGLFVDRISAFGSNV